VSARLRRPALPTAATQEQQVAAAMMRTGACADYILQRTGGRPLQFRGILFDCLDDSFGAAWSRVRLALYRCEPEDYVTEIRCESAFGETALRPWCFAARHPSLAAALHAFENASPAAEIRCEAADASRLLAASARARRETMRVSAFRHAVGTFLHALATR